MRESFRKSLSNNRLTHPIRLIETMTFNTTPLIHNTTEPILRITLHRLATIMPLLTCIRSPSRRCCSRYTTSIIIVRKHLETSDMRILAVHMVLHNDHLYHIRVHWSAVNDKSDYVLW